MNLTRLMGLVVAATLSMSANASASSLYDFTTDLADSSGSAPSMSSLGGSLDSGFYVFGPNLGLTLAWSAFDPASYDISMRFSFTTVGASSSWRKILDFDGRTTDEGLYAFNDHLQFVETASAHGTENFVNGPAGTFVPDQLLDLHIVRNASSKQFSAFINGALQFSFVDTNNRAVFSGSNPVATFFADDTVTSGEFSAGRADFIAVAPVPVPPALPLMASALGLLGWRGKRRVCRPI